MQSENRDWTMNANDKEILKLQYLCLSVTSHSCQMSFSLAPHFVLQQNGPNVFSFFFVNSVDDSEKILVSAIQRPNSKRESISSVSLTRQNPSVFTVWNSFGVFVKLVEMIVAVDQKVSDLLIVYEIICRNIRNVRHKKTHMSIVE